MSIVFLKDLAERTVTTFLEAWFGAWLLLADQRVEDLFDPKVVGAGVAAAAVAVGKALVARHVGDPDSASLAAEV